MRFVKFTVSMMALVGISAGALAASAPVTKTTARAIPGLMLDPAQRAAALASTAPRTTTHRIKQGGTNTSGATRLQVSQLQRALQGPTKSRSRNKDVNALVSDAQHRALKALNDATQADGGVDAHFDPRNGTLAFLKPRGKNLSVNTRGLLPGTFMAGTVAQQFLAEHRALLKLDDPQLETRVTQQFADTGGRTHVRLQQTFQGVPLFGKELLVHLQGANGVYLVQGSSEPTPRGLNTTPGITAAAALTTVRADLNTAADRSALTELVIYTLSSGAAVLAFKIDITPTLDSRWIYFVDAVTGVIVHRIQNIQDATVTASGTDLNGVGRSFSAWQEAASQFYLIDRETPTPDTSNPVTNGPSPSGDTFILTAGNGNGSQLAYVTSSTQTTGWGATAVSAAYNTRAVFNYYQNTFNRNSIDGKGKNLMVAIHFQNNLDNAFWNGTFMVYGDGGQVFKPLAGCLDVAAHEMTHGVIESSANLVYENQSGALNESFADVFGAMVDSDDWLMGEDCTKASPGYLRNMMNPALGLSAQPTKMSQYQNLPNTEQGDNGGVHVNSGIPNRAAYLIAEGLSTEGLGTSIGRAKTEQIFYRALTNYLTASAQFVDARRATIQAATDLYGTGSAEVQAVTKAWDVVEVTDGAAGGGTKPTPTTPVSGNDIMVYLHPQDDVFNDVQEPFRLALQVMDRPFTGYDINKDSFLPMLTSPASYTRPAVYTDSSGTVVFYVGMDNNLYVTGPGGSAVQVLSSADISSIAISPDGRYFAYTRTDATDNNIYVLDLVADTSVTIPIIPVDYQQGATGADTIRYADSLAFDYTGRKLVFDALNCITTPTSNCATGAGYQYWSIGFVNVNTAQLSFPFANQNPAIDVGYPSFAANNSFVIAFDFQDWTDPASIVSKVVTANLEDQTVQTVHDFGTGAAPVWGVPSFWGDDTYVSYQAPGGTAGSTVSRVGLDTSWAGSGFPLALNPDAVVMPVMHRAGVRTLTGGLTASTALVDFGAVTNGESKSLTLTLSNAGNSDVNILSATLSGSAFTSNAFNTRIPHGQSIPVTLTFTPGNTSGTQTGTLAIGSDGDPSSLTISLSGTTPVSTPPPTKKKSGGGDINGVTLVLMVMVFASVYQVQRRRRVSNLRHSNM